MQKKTIIVDKIDKVANILTQQGFSYNYALKLLRNKDVKVDGARMKENLTVFPGCEITVFFETEKQEKGYEIVYEDANVYVLNKKAGVEVEGENGLTKRLPNARAVHRLDRNTEGLMILAKNMESETVLVKAFKNRTIEKRYLAEVVGSTAFTGEIYTAYLMKNAETAMVKIYDKPMKGVEKIETAFKTLSSNPASSLVDCRLLTGKTHQLRAHLAYLGHPIIGDGKYGKNSDNKKFKQKKQQLFCYYLELNGLTGNLEYLNGRTFKLKPYWLNKEIN